MVDFQCKAHYNWEDFLEIMRLLRSPDGCPWDREQTHESIRQDLIEECYEVIEGIDSGSDAIMKEELGDLLFAVVNLARFLKVNSELALLGTNRKFPRRFHLVLLPYFSSFRLPFLGLAAA